MHTIADFFRTKAGIIVASILGLLVVGGLVTFFVVKGFASDDEDSAPSSAPEGQIAVEDAPPLPPLDEAQPAQPAPEEPVPQVALSEGCATAAEPLRAVIAEYPSGLVLDEAGSTRLNEGLNSMSDGCTVEEIAAFQGQELIPWTTYSAPSS